MRLRFLGICSLLLVFMSCEKYGGGYIEGTVVEAETGLPYKNAVVHLVRYYHFTEDVDSVTTDNAGKYTIVFEKKRGYQYFVYAKPVEFYTDPSFYTETRIQLEEKNSVRDITMYPTGYLRIHLSKTSYSSNYVEISFTDVLYPSFFLPNHHFPFDSILPPYKIWAQRNIYFSWAQKEQGIPSPNVIMYQDTLFVNKDDTLDYYISFQ